ncbi:MAG: hypothetical protein ACYTG0_20770, partial [Planctomycetota bacterium]
KYVDEALRKDKKQARKMMRPNKITGANAGGPRQLPMRTASQPTNSCWGHSETSRHEADEREYEISA